MSYNYLPLDKSHTNFQQIKDLLGFGQQVSITFAAHENIQKCREYLDKNGDYAGQCCESGRRDVDSVECHSA